MLQDHVLAQMKNDDIAFIAKRDDLILMFGSVLLDKNGIRQKEYVSQRMRQLAQLLLQLNTKVEGSLESFFETGSL
jgi:hypothetical protein